MSDPGVLAALTEALDQWQIIGVYSDHDPNCPGGGPRCAELCPIPVQYALSTEEAAAALETIVAARERAAVEAAAVPLLAKWSGCWCGAQMADDHDPRVRDCPQHGDDSCRHMAEGITLDLRALMEGNQP